MNRLKLMPMGSSYATLSPSQVCPALKVANGLIVMSSSFLPEVHHLVKDLAYERVLTREARASRKFSPSSQPRKSRTGASFRTLQSWSPRL